jgi:hypothetical protein
MTGTLTRVSPEDFRTNLDRMAALCSKRGARFFVFIPCLYHEYGRGELIPSVDFKGSHALPVLEALSQYPKDALRTLFLPFDEAHLSVKGHGLVGQGLADFLKIAGILGEKSAKPTKR